MKIIMVFKNESGEWTRLVKTKKEMYEYLTWAMNNQTRTTIWKINFKTKKNV